MEKVNLNDPKDIIYGRNNNSSFNAESQ